MPRTSTTSVSQKRQRRTGDGDSLALLLQDDLLQRGYRVEVVFGREVLRDPTEHAWCELWDDRGNRIVLDPYFSVWKMNPDGKHWVPFVVVPERIAAKLVEYRARVAAGE
jgi:hypothetical protein